MGSSIGSGFPRQGTSAAFYGNDRLPKLSVKPEGRHTMPGGPRLPTLPRNPYAVAARKIGRLATPQQPKNLNDMFGVRGGVRRGLRRKQSRSDLRLSLRHRCGPLDHQVSLRQVECGAPLRAAATVACHRDSGWADLSSIAFLCRCWDRRP